MFNWFYKTSEKTAVSPAILTRLSSSWSVSSWTLTEAGLAKQRGRVVVGREHWSWFRRGGERGEIRTAGRLGQRPEKEERLDCLQGAPLNRGGLDQSVSSFYSDTLHLAGHRTGR